MKIHNIKIFSGFLLLFIFACNSPEFTSLKMYVQEGNLEKAEENGLKALQLEPENALVPYVLAVDVYLKQKQYDKMAEMFDETMRRNPDQRLERPFTVEDQVVNTVGEAVGIYREQEWSRAFNNGVQFYNEKDMDKAILNFELSSKIDPKNGKSYSTLAALYIGLKDLPKAKMLVEKAMKIDSEDEYATLAALYIELKDLSKAKMLIEKAMKIDPKDEQAIITAGNIATLEDDTQGAIRYYLQAADLSKKPAPIMKKLIFLYIDIEEYDQAIEYSMKVLKSYPYDSDIYYNIGVLYQRLASNHFNDSRDKFVVISDMDEWDQGELQEIDVSFKQARLYSVEAREYFQQACDLETMDSGACDAASEMKKLKIQLDTIFIPAVEEMMQ
ncbi:MAG: hypothetical protein HQ510_09845 [Candidatus Marinimicrobia bacterium]|nr:hypothetical protein [Candidatus Neomarinimicrobiota bacterium]